MNGRQKEKRAGEEKRMLPEGKRVRELHHTS
jgi:hypothetical protein